MNYLFVLAESREINDVWHIHFEKATVWSRNAVVKGLEKIEELRTTNVMSTKYV